MTRALCSDGSDTRLCKKSIIAYRLDNDTDVDPKTIASVSLNKYLIWLTMILIQISDLNFQQILFSQVLIEQDESVAAAVLKTFRKIVIPACELFNEYGLCTPVMKNDFVYGLKMIGQFFTSEFMSFNHTQDVGA